MLSTYGGYVKRACDYEARWRGKLGFWQVVRVFFCAVIRHHEYGAVDDFRGFCQAFDMFCSMVGCCDPGEELGCGAIVVAAPGRGCLGCFGVEQVYSRR